MNCVRSGVAAFGLAVCFAVPAQAQGWQWPGEPRYVRPFYPEWDVPRPYRGRQGWQYEDPRYDRPPSVYRGRSYRYERDEEDEPPRRMREWERDSAPRPFGREPGPKVASGGARPYIEAKAPQSAPFPWSYAPGTIVIETRERQLFLVRGEGRALRYPISVGREGFQWTGSEKISRIAEWPDWHPPEDMRRRQPGLPEKMTGGLRNPLGAKALYLGNTLYRIHGTNDPRTIGHASSSGCFRMLNAHVLDLASRVGIGTRVVVVNRLPRQGVAFQSSRQRPRDEQDADED
ncbi:MAG: L,D-transpeptidase [Hyphomicrobiaceae bacterium]